MEQIEPALHVVRRGGLLCARRQCWLSIGHSRNVWFKPRHMPYSKFPQRPIATRPWTEPPSIGGTIVTLRQETFKAIVEGRAARCKAHPAFHHAQPFVNASAQTELALDAVASCGDCATMAASERLSTLGRDLEKIVLHQKRPGKGGQTMSRGRTT